MKTNNFQDNYILEKAAKMGWELLAFSDVLIDETRKVIKIKKRDYLKTGNIPIIDQGASLIGGFSNLGDGYYDESPFIVFGDHTRIFKYIEKPSFIGADGVKVLKEKSKDKINIKYVYYFLETVDIPNTGYNRHFKYLKEVIIPIPPIDIQTKIVYLLDKMENIIAKRKQQIVALSSLERSIFLDMFGDPVNNPKKIEKQPLKNIGVIQTGNTPPRKIKEYYGNHIEWIKSGNIIDGNIYLTVAKEYLSEKGAAKGRVAEAGSILVTCIAGSKKSIGKAAIADRDVAFNQQVNAISPYENVNTYFLYAQILLSKKLIEQHSTNGMKGLISKSSFEKIEFLVPSLKEQEAFSTISENLFKQKEMLEKSLSQLEHLYNSIMQKAFTGELFYN